MRWSTGAVIGRSLTLRTSVRSRKCVLDGQRGEAMAKRNSPWGETTLKVGDCRHWRVGPLGFWVRRAELEWQVTEERYDDEGLAVATKRPAPPEDAVWTRWASGEVDPPVRIRPMTPDRPVVVRPAQPFRVLKGGTARIYIRMPVWVRIELAVENDPLPLIDIPTVRMSNTWFGSVFEGTLCYWTETSARRRYDNVEPRPHLVTTPMFIHNKVEAELPLEKLCLRTAGLGIYEGSGELWASEVRATNTGPGAPEQIEISSGPPEEAREAELVFEPRQKPRGGMLARTFGFLGSLPGLDGGVVG